MRPIQTIAILILTALFAALSICSPDFLSKNKFLVDFVNHEYINVLSVVVTVSLFSVTQIHLEYSRIERRFKVKVFEEARKTINLGALLLTSMLVLSFLISFIRAELIGNPTAVSLIHSISLSNENRINYLVSYIESIKPKTLGVYKIEMKKGSDNSRESSILNLILKLKKNIRIIIFDKNLIKNISSDFEIINNLKKFGTMSDLIITNRVDESIMEYKNKLFSSGNTLA